MIENLYRNKISVIL